MRFELSHTEHRETEFDADSLDAAMRVIRDLLPGWRVDYVDDEAVVGQCESCGCVVLESDDYGADVNGVVLCKRHKWDGQEVSDARDS